jgi:hypothetical protein
MRYSTKARKLSIQRALRSNNDGFLVGGAVRANLRFMTPIMREWTADKAGHTNRVDTYY